MTARREEERLLPESLNWQEVQVHTVTHDLAIGSWCPEGRWVALYADRKAGKTEFTQQQLVADLNGRPWVYLDYEMGLDDVRDRFFDDLELSPEDLKGLRYYQHPGLRPLDTEEGGRDLMRLLERDDAAGVIIDTTPRCVQGDENSNDTWRDLWTFTGSLVHRAGLTGVRIDHQGKDPQRGQRGGSSKNDDVDVVWHLTRTDLGCSLDLKYSRLSWLPQQLHYVRQEQPVAYVENWMALLPQGALETAVLLDRLHAPLDISRRAAEKTLRTAGHRHRSETVAAAVRYRKYCAESDAKEDEMMAVGGPIAERRSMSDSRQSNPGTTREPPKSGLWEPVREPAGTIGQSPR